MPLADVDLLAFLLPVLLFRGLESIAVISLAQAVLLDKVRKCVTHVCFKGVCVCAGMEKDREVPWRERHSGNVGAQRHDPHDLGVEAVVAVRASDLLDLVAPRGRNHLLEERVRTIERHERADGVAAETDCRVGDQLLGVLDDRAVRPTQRLWRATLGAPGRDSVDQDLELVGHQRIEANEVLFAERLVAIGLQRNGCGELVPVLVESVTDSRRAVGVLVEDAPAGHLVDIRREQVDTDREPVDCLGQLGLLAFEAVDHVGELLLRRGEQPERTLLLLAGLSETLEAEHPVSRPSDVLASLVNDEHEALCPGTAPCEHLQRTVSEPVSVDLRCAGGIRPRVC